MRCLVYKMPTDVGIFILIGMLYNILWGSIYDTLKFQLPHVVRIGPNMLYIVSGYWESQTANGRHV